MLSDIDGENVIVTPQIGHCSSYEESAELAAQPYLPKLWFECLLALIEFKIQIGLTYFYQFFESLKKTTIDLDDQHKLNYYKIIWEVVLTYQLNEPVLYYLKEWLETGVKTKPEYAALKIDKLWLEYLYGFSFLVLISGKDINPYLRIWMQDGARYGGNLFSLTHQFIEEVQQTSANNQITLINQTLNGSDQIRTLSASYLLLKSSKTEDLYAAYLILWSQFSSMAFQDQHEIKFEEKFKQDWKKIILEKRFSLRNPNITVPEIENALEEDSSRGYKKVARVLLVLRSAVNLSIAQEFYVKLLQYANK